MGHRQEICGLKWSPDGQLLASGGNDNKLIVWNKGERTTPFQTYSDHVAAVKAIAWSPHQVMFEYCKVYLKYILNAIFEQKNSTVCLHRVAELLTDVSSFGILLLNNRYNQSILVPRYDF